LEIAVNSDFLARDFITIERLVAVLNDCRPPPLGWHLATRAGCPQPTGAAALLDFLATGIMFETAL
jgi:DNA-binding transcriptional LysR family regulator